MNKTCADCIHYDVCQYHITEETTMTVNECSHSFKDKSLFIELPCAVGDTVYMSFEGGITPLLIFRISTVQRMGEEVKRCYDAKGEKVATSFSDHHIGKTVFFTRKEAEQVLQVYTSKELDYVEAKDLDKNSFEFKEALETLKRL